MISRFLDRGDSNAAPNLRSVTWVVRVTGAITAVVILFAGAFGHRILERYGVSLKDQHSAAVSSIRDAARIESAHSALEQQVTAARLRTEKAVGRVPGTANEIEFLREFSSIAKRAELEIREFRPGATSEFATHSEMEFFIRAEGEFASLCRLLAAVGEMPRVCRVSQMTITAPTAGNTIGQIELHVALAFGLKPIESA